MNKIEYYCPKGCELPTKRNIISESINILNKCYFCGHSPIWDNKGKFLGTKKCL